MRAIVVDDEPLGVKRIVRLLSNANVDVVATGSNGYDAVKLTKLHSVDLLFLDIDMPKKNGIEAAQEIVTNLIKAPAIIFCTAYDSFALDAFKAQATNYLLKPVSANDLKMVIEKAGQLNQLQLSNLEGVDSFKKTISIEHADYVEKKPIESVLYFRAEKKLVLAGLLDQSEIAINYTLKVLYERFGEGFLRIHRNLIVNKLYLNRLIRDGEKYCLLLKHTDRTFAVSRRHLSEVKKCF